MTVSAGGQVTFETAVGACSMAWSDSGLTRVHLLSRADCTHGSPDVPAAVEQAIDQLTAYMAGGHVSFDDIVLDMTGVADFNAEIYRVLRTVGYGKTTTYGALARSIGADVGSSRAVGVAMSRNPWPVIVPCHRVLASGGKIGGFSAPGGADTKRKLLALEGVLTDGDMPTLPGLF